jgi:hypothetical protein
MKNGIKYSIAIMTLAGISYLSFLTFKRFLEAKRDATTVTLQEADEILNNL